jgi:hypothetical protein
MLKLLKSCTPWLTWKVGIAVILGVTVLTSFDKLLGLALLAGATPVLLALACLIPCLIPLAFLGKKKVATSVTQVENTKSTTKQTCDCGSDSCQIGENAG